MRKIILLLPNPDNLQLAVVHKYVTHRKYVEVYTLETIKNIQGPKTVTKLLIIGHGRIGHLNEGFDTYLEKKNLPRFPFSILATAIVKSQIILNENLKITMNQCHSGTRSNGPLSSSLDLLTAHLNVQCKHKNITKVKYTIVGYVGPTFTAGIRKRLVLKDLDKAVSDEDCTPQINGLKPNKDLRNIPQDWSEDMTSDKIKELAEEKYKQNAQYLQDLEKFFWDNPKYIRQGPDRKLQTNQDEYKHFHK